MLFYAWTKRYNITVLRTPDLNRLGVKAVKRIEVDGN